MCLLGVFKSTGITKHVKTNHKNTAIQNLVKPLYIRPAVFACLFPSNIKILWKLAEFSYPQLGRDSFPSLLEEIGQAGKYFL